MAETQIKNMLSERKNQTKISDLKEAVGKKVLGFTNGKYTGQVFLKVEVNFSDGGVRGIFLSTENRESL